MGALGLISIEAPEEYGAPDSTPWFCHVLALEEVSKADASHGTIMSVNNSLFCNGIYLLALKRKRKNIHSTWRVRQKIGRLLTTESMSGSDSGNNEIVRRARR